MDGAWGPTAAEGCVEGDDGEIAVADGVVEVELRGSVLGV